MKPSMLLVTLLLAACAPKTAPAPQSPLPRAAVNAGARARVWAISDTMKLSRAAAIARYGRPLSMTGDTVRSFNNPDVVDSVIRLRFAHVENTYDVHANRREELRNITVSTPAGGVLRSVGPGASRDSLVAFLGAPDADEAFEQGRLLLYEMPRDTVREELGNVMNVYVVGNRVRWISWIFFPVPAWPAR